MNKLVFIIACLLLTGCASTQSINTIQQPSSTPNNPIEVTTPEPTQEVEKYAPQEVDNETKDYIYDKITTFYMNEGISDIAIDIRERTEHKIFILALGEKNKKECKSIFIYNIPTKLLTEATRDFGTGIQFATEILDNDTLSAYATIGLEPPTQISLDRYSELVFGDDLIEGK